MSDEKYSPTKFLKDAVNTHSSIVVVPDHLSQRSTDSMDYTEDEVLACMHHYWTWWSTAHPQNLRREAMLGLALDRGQQAISLVMSCIEPTYPSYKPSRLMARLLALHAQSPVLVESAARDAYLRAGLAA